MKNVFLKIAMAFVLCSISLGAQAQLPAPTSDNLKTAILKISKATTNLKAARPAVRKVLDVLILRLESTSSKVDEARWAQYAPGSWRQVWSDEADMSPPGAPVLNLNKIFQYVSPMGRAVNFAERLPEGAPAVTFALEALGTVKGNLQTTRILKAFASDEGISEDFDLQSVAQEILDGTSSNFKDVKAGTFPRGPIGAESVITIRYVDENLKIGTAPNVRTGDEELFILERMAQ